MLQPSSDSPTLAPHSPAPPGPDFFILILLDFPNSLPPTALAPTLSPPPPLLILLKTIIANRLK